MVEPADEGGLAQRCRLALCASVLLLSACQAGVLDPQGPIGRAQRTMLWNATAVMLAIIIPVILLTLAFAWWFRGSNTRAVRRPDWSYSGTLEMVVWAIPALVIMFLGGMAWVGSHELDPGKPIASDTKPLEVQVVSMDWKWLFIYPELGIASVNELVVPANTPLSLRLTSTSVMNSFFVPQLGSQIYTMSGMQTRLHLLADAPGRYPGISAQFSGAGFSDMRFAVLAMSASEFDRWVSDTRGGQAPLDAAQLDRLKQPSQADKVATYSAVQPGLFDSLLKPMPMATSAPHAEHGTR